MLTIEAQGLVKAYPRVKAVDGVSFEAREGEILGLLGPNGAGKSTTVKMLATLVTPDAGGARVAGFDIVRDAGEVRRNIGYVAQASGVDKEATGRENLVLHGQLHRMGRQALSQRVEELLALLDLGEAADRLVRGYSGGMRRRLDVAMGLVHTPRVLFLDEPTTGLDPESRAAMWSELERLRQDTSLTILLTTHYLEEADRLSDRLLIIDHGRIVVEGTPEELKREMRGDSVAIELPPPSLDRGRGVLAALDGVREALHDSRAVHLRVDDGARAVPGLLSALEAAGIIAASVTVARPSLDDVYLHYAGRSFAEADAEAPEQPKPGRSR